MNPAPGELTAELEQLELPWAPFSRLEHMWHACPGHEWERIDWQTWRPGRAVERVTRCRVCGAPRCDSLSVPDGVTMSDLTDRGVQAIRCTKERHHDRRHDYLPVTRRQVLRHRRSRA